MVPRQWRCATNKIDTRRVDEGQSFTVTRLGALALVCANDAVLTIVVTRDCAWKNTFVKLSPYCLPMVLWVRAGRIRCSISNSQLHSFNPPPRVLVPKSDCSLLISPLSNKRFSNVLRLVKHGNTHDSRNEIRTRALNQSWQSTHQANIFRLGSSQLFISYIEAEFKPQVVLFLRWCRIGWWLIQVNKLRLLKFVGDFMKSKETLGNLRLVVLGKPNDSQAHFQMNHVFVRERTLSSENVKLWNSSSWIFKAMGKMLGRCYTSHTNELFFLFMGALSIKSRTCDNEKWHNHQLPLERSIPCYFKFCKKNIFLFSCVCVIFIF